MSVRAHPPLDVGRTRERLSALGCVHASEVLANLLSEAESGDLGPHAFLDALLGAELENREERRVRAMPRSRIFRRG